MTITKLPSGSYRIRQQIDGKRYSVTLDHKPNQTECALLLAQMVKDAPTLSIEGTLRQCIGGYIESKSNILSPSTIRGYKQISRQISGILMDMQVKDITLPILQNEINRYAQDHAPKSVANFSGFLTSVCRFVGLDIKSPTLPQKTHSEAYIPSKNDIQRICEYIKNTEYEIPILLSLHGLRRSEICALVPSDLKGNTLTINKALVTDDNNNWIVKITKTPDSTRTVVISDYLADLIRENGKVYDGYPNQILKALQRACRKLNIPQFQLHKMRHFYASYLHDLGYSDKQIQDAGGWKNNSRVLQNIYKHSMDMEEAKKNMANDLQLLTK